MIFKRLPLYLVEPGEEPWFVRERGPIDPDDPANVRFLVHSVHWNRDLEVPEPPTDRYRLREIRKLLMVDYDIAPTLAAIERALYQLAIRRRRAAEEASRDPDPIMREHRRSLELRKKGGRW